MTCHTMTGQTLTNRGMCPCGYEKGCWAAEVLSEICYLVPLVKQDISAKNINKKN